jgi:ribosomal protein L40E
MVKKTLGYVELEWTCPSCGARNPGTKEICQSCGSKMPEGAEFELPAKQELDTSAETAARVAAGPDIHCPYCGARNPGNATSCSKCGGDLSEGAKRAKGKVLGAQQTGPVPDVACPHCGASNPAAAAKCSSCGGNLQREKPQAQPVAVAARKKSSPLPVVLILAALLLCVFGGIFLLTRGASETVAQVQSVEWTYEIELEERGPVTREDWRDQIPSGARLGNCQQKVRSVEQEPVAGAKEVCGTPYVVDTGTGKGETVQDCEYEVSDDWCQYTVTDWKLAAPVVETGNDLNPTWPAVRASANLRESKRNEKYQVTLDADGKDHVYHPNDLQEFKQFQIGSKWILETNVLGGVTSITPAD